MDNLCHTLVGAALAEAGLARRRPLATATLLIGANLPDVDAFTDVFSDGLTSLAVRRGSPASSARATTPARRSPPRRGFGRFASFSSGRASCTSTSAGKKNPRWSPPATRAIRAAAARGPRSARSCP